MSDIEKNILSAVREGLQKAVTEKLTGYNSPLDAVLKGVIDSHCAEIRGLLVSAVSEAVKDVEFCQQIRDAMRSKMAKVLIEKFGGELEKQVNQLKSDPATRARITLAIEEIVKPTK